MSGVAVSPLKMTLLAGIFVLQGFIALSIDGVKFSGKFEGEFEVQSLNTLPPAVFKLYVPKNIWLRLHFTTEPEKECKRFLGPTSVQVSTGDGGGFLPKTIDYSGHVYHYVHWAGDVEIRVLTAGGINIRCDVKVKYTAAVVLDIHGTWEYSERFIPYWKQFYVVSHFGYRNEDYRFPELDPPGGDIDVSIIIPKYNRCSRVQITLLDYNLDDDRDRLTLLVGGEPKDVFNSKFGDSQPEIFNNDHGKEITLRLRFDGRVLKSDEGFLLKYEVVDEGCTLNHEEAEVIKQLTLITNSTGNCSYSFMCSPPGFSRLEKLLSMSCSGNSWNGLTQCNYTMPESANEQDQNSANAGQLRSLTVGLAAGIPLIVLLIVALILAVFYLHKKNTKQRSGTYQAPTSAQPQYYNGDCVMTLPSREDDSTYQNIGVARVTFAEESPSDAADEDHTYYNDLPSSVPRSANTRKFRDIGEEYTTVQLNTKLPRTTTTPTAPPRASAQISPRVQLVDNDLYGS